MWFKQIQLFNLDASSKLAREEIAQKMDGFRFRPCLPSHSFSVGWVAPEDAAEDDDESPLLKSINHHLIFCLKIEEKILPMTVIRQALADSVKQIEASENRQLRHKEKASLKDEITITLLPRAFSRIHRVYAYIDTKNNTLLLGTTHVKMTEHFVSLVKKSVCEDLTLVQFSGISSTLTSWLKHQNYASTFSVEKGCLLQDPRKENRKIRCQQQDLFAPSIQSIIQEGCEVTQLALCWQDRVSFVLSKDFSLKSIQYHDEITDQANEMEPESEQQRFQADFLIMSGTLSSLLDDLLSQFSDALKSNNVITMAKQA